MFCFSVVLINFYEVSLTAQVAWALVMCLPLNPSDGMFQLALPESHALAECGANFSMSTTWFESVREGLRMPGRPEQLFSLCSKPLGVICQNLFQKGRLRDWAFLLLALSLKTTLRVLLWVSHLIYPALPANIHLFTNTSLVLILASEF